MAGYTPRQFTCPQAVTHPSSNRAQCNLINYVGRSKCANLYITLPPELCFLWCRNLWSGLRWHAVLPKNRKDILGGKSNQQSFFQKNTIYIVSSSSLVTVKQCKWHLPYESESDAMLPRQLKDVSSCNMGLAVHTAASTVHTPSRSLSLQPDNVQTAL